MTDYRKWPYGCYLCAGSVVYFNRRFEPIIRVTQPAFPAVGNQVVTVCDPRERIEHTGKEYFYSDCNSPSRDKQTRARLDKLLATIPELAAEIKRRDAEA